MTRSASAADATTGQGIYANNSSADQAPYSNGYYPGGCASYHYVHYGESLSVIAEDYGVSMYALAQANGIHDPNHVYAGQKLCIPQSYYHQPVQPQPMPMPSEQCGYYTVKHGDILSAIAQWHGTSVPALMQANGLYDPNHIYVGQTLVIPCGHQPSHPKPTHPKPTHPKPAHPTPVPHPTQPPCHCQPTPQPPATPGVPQGYWLGSYYNNPSLDGAPIFTRDDAMINFQWGEGGPGGGVPNDGFGVSWVRAGHFHQGNYRFFATVDDGIRIYVDDTLVLDAWRVQPSTSYFGDVYMPAGYHTIRVEYYEESGNAEIEVTWVKL